MARNFIACGFNNLGRLKQWITFSGFPGSNLHSSWVNAFCYNDTWQMEDEDGWVEAATLRIPQVRSGMGNLGNAHDWTLLERHIKETLP